MSEYIDLKNLVVYKQSREISKLSWKLYTDFSWKTQKIVGDQFIRSIDSIGANIAEGYGRYHYLDKIKFYYNARGSLFEAIHWSQIINERKIDTGKSAKEIEKKLIQLTRPLNNLITANYKQKTKST